MMTAMIFFNDLKSLSLSTCLYGRFGLAPFFWDCRLTASKDNNHNHTLNRLRESRPALPTQFQCHWPLFLVELTGSPRWVSSERKRLLLQLEVGRHCAVTSTRFNFILEPWMFSDVSRCFHFALWMYMSVHDCTCLSLFEALIWQEVVCYSENRETRNLILYQDFPCKNCTFSRLFPIYPISSFIFIHFLTTQYPAAKN